VAADAELDWAPRGGRLRLAGNGVERECRLLPAPGGILEPTGLPWGGSRVADIVEAWLSSSWATGKPAGRRFAP
jgi:hypothetical protein